MTLAQPPHWLFPRSRSRLMLYAAPMNILVQINLSGADLSLFDAYERQVLALLPKYGAALEARVRSCDDRQEVHLLHFPDPDAFEAFRNDPARLAAQDIWNRSGATSCSEKVTHIS